MTATSPTVAGSPWLRIWTHPRSTIRDLLIGPPSPAIWGLAVLNGIAQSLVQGAQNSVGARAPVAVILPSTILVGAIWGILQLHLVSGLLFLVGRWTSGRATFRQMRTVVAWSTVPQSVVVATWLIGTAVFGRLLFVDVDALGATPPPALALGMLLIFLISFTCIVWSFVILVQGLAEAQGISAWKALGTVVAAVLMFGVAVLVVITIVLGVVR